MTSRRAPDSGSSPSADAEIVPRSGVIAVTGASGFVGSHLCDVLTERGYDVRALTRSPQKYDGAGTAVECDVEDPHSVMKALEGCDAAYYLVHSLDSSDFADKDARSASYFAHAAAENGLRQIVYLGGLGDDGDDLSEHLASRREVEKILGRGGVPLTVLRAAVIIGDGGVSWEMTRQLVERLPAVVTPSWAQTRTQPIALVDAIRYLAGVLGHPDAIGQTFDIGGADVVTYTKMLTTAARVIKGRRLPALGVPLMTPFLSTHWLTLVTDVDKQTARSLIESMNNEVVVQDTRIRDVVPGEPLTYAEAVREAHRTRVQRLADEANVAAG